ncbi:hypothetical protein B0T17DRAFT_269818 [Bombardia bombarda]|uniref:Uncharacterized protein n=1 Tax=Bombardia bombarda TaxID=252184 RepID=A0AA39X1A2_9PEZI|nr:hypothetical protein B0T17DRAFT_269818 [Bombardia bombarda]
MQAMGGTGGVCPLSSPGFLVCHPDSEQAKRHRQQQREQQIGWPSPVTAQQKEITGIAAPALMDSSRTFFCPHPRVVVGLVRSPIFPFMGRREVNCYHASQARHPQSESSQWIQHILRSNDMVMCSSNNALFAALSLIGPVLLTYRVMCTFPYIHEHGTKCLRLPRYSGDRAADNNGNVVRIPRASPEDAWGLGSEAVNTQLNIMRT